MIYNIKDTKRFLQVLSCKNDAISLYTAKGFTIHANQSNIDIFD